MRAFSGLNAFIYKQCSTVQCLDIQTVQVDAIAALGEFHVNSANAVSSDALSANMHHEATICAPYLHLH